MVLAKYMKIHELDTDLETYLKRHPELFEAVDTGYQTRDGRTPEAELIYHGHETHTCRHCGGVLKKKTMGLKKKKNGLRVVNGYAKAVEDASGRLYIIWVCTRVCERCAKNQRVLPVFAARWMRSTLFTIGRTLLHLFANDEQNEKPLKQKWNRPWLTMPFYGEMSTVYRWRQKIKIIFDL